MIFDTIQGFHGFESRPQHFFEPRISSPLKTTRTVDKIIVCGMYGPPPGRTGPRNTEKVIRVSVFLKTFLKGKIFAASLRFWSPPLQKKIAASRRFFLEKIFAASRRF